MSDPANPSNNPAPNTKPAPSTTSNPFATPSSNAPVNPTTSIPLTSNTGNNGGTFSIPISQPITWIFSTGFAPIQQTPPEPAKPAVKSDGCHCKKCKEFYPYAEPNQEDGTLICYSCRMVW